jgi:hypothetical protein
VKPTGNHETEIARIVDQISVEGRLDLASIQEVIMVLNFMMTGTDTQFLVEYIRWRMDHPIVK